MSLRSLTASLSDLQGHHLTTAVTTLAALVVSSLAVLVCVALNRVPDTALGLYLGAWVTHAGVQGHQRLKVAAATAAQNSGDTPDAQ